MKEITCDFAIIGAGPAGLAAAVQAAQAKPAVCVRAELGPLPWKANCKNVPLLI